MYTSIHSAHFLFDHVSTIGIWNKDQFLFFLGFMLYLDSLHMIIVSENFWELSFDLKMGKMDFHILKPINLIFNTFFRSFRSSSLLGNILLTIYLIYYGLRLDFSFFDWFILPIFIVLSFLLLIILEFIISTAMFWVTEGIGINFLRMQFQSISRWPHFVYTEFPRKIFLTVLPFLLIGSAPMEFFFNQGKMELLIYQFLCIVIFGFILKYLWNKGLNHYDSASS